MYARMIDLSGSYFQCSFNVRDSKTGINDQKHENKQILKKLVFVYLQDKSHHEWVGGYVRPPR